MSILYNNKSGATPQAILLAGNTNTDQILNGTSKNAIANKAVYAALQDKIDKAVQDLVYYYTKSDVYNKAETRALLSTISSLDIKVVNSLPVSDISTTTIYFLKPTGSQNYDEYVYVDNAWVKIGDTGVDLSQYLEIDDFEIAIADYYTKAEIDAKVAGYYTKAEVDTLLDEINTEVDGKQDTLTFDNTPTAGSNNPVKSSGIYDALLTKAEQSEVNDIVNIYGSKNLLNTSIVTIPSGLSVTLNKDKSVTINGTNTSAGEIRLFSSTGAELQYLNGCILSGITTGSNSTYFLRVVERNTPWTHYARVYTEEQIISGIPNDNRIVDVGLYVYNNQTFNSFTFYPMIRLGTIVDSTYQPYAETNYQLTQSKMSYADNGILGAKNLLLFPYYNGAKTESGLTFSIDSKNGLVVSGSNTGSATFGFSFQYNQDVSNLVGKTITVSLENAPLNKNGYCPFILKDSSGTIVARYDIDSEHPSYTLTVPSTAKTYDFQLYVRVGKSINATLYPMIRLASDPDDTYQPYAMTNRELTEHHTTVAKTFTQSSTDVATYLRNANTSGYIAFGYSYNRTMIVVNAIFTVKASGNALYKSDGTTATSGNENWELIKIPNFPYNKAIPDGPLSGLLFLNRTDLKDLYCSKRGNDLIFAISATDYADFVGKGIRLSATIMLK